MPPDCVAHSPPCPTSVSAKKEGARTNTSGGSRSRRRDNLGNPKRGGGGKLEQNVALFFSRLSFVCGEKNKDILTVYSKVPYIVSLTSNSVMAPSFLCL